MTMLEDCINKIFDTFSGQSPKANLTHYEQDKELYKSIYYHLCDYKGVLDKSIELNNEIGEISNRWKMLGDWTLSALAPQNPKKANE